jgi:hypothetical protein
MGSAISSSKMHPPEMILVEDVVVSGICGFDESGVHSTYGSRELRCVLCQPEDLTGSGSLAVAILGTLVGIGQIPCWEGEDHAAVFYCNYIATEYSPLDPSFHACS